MTDILWMLSITAALGFSYIVRFTEATLSFGRELADSESGTGFQDSITPPWETKLQLIIYLAIVLIFFAMWWQAGWLSALGAIAVMIFGSFFARFVLPKKNGLHYKNLIIKSMYSRYADFVRDSDVVRAGAMKALLIKAGLHPDRLTCV